MQNYNVSFLQCAISGFTREVKSSDGNVISIKTCDELLGRESSQTI